MRESRNPTPDANHLARQPLYPLHHHNAIAGLPNTALKHATYHPFPLPPSLPFPISSLSHYNPLLSPPHEPAPKKPNTHITAPYATPPRDPPALSFRHTSTLLHSDQVPAAPVAPQVKLSPSSTKSPQVKTSRQPRPTIPFPFCLSRLRTAERHHSNLLKKGPAMIVSFVGCLRG